MSILFGVGVSLVYFPDGAATSFSFDVRTTPLQSSISEIVNFSLPSGVQVAPSENYTATLNGHVVTITFASPPPIGGAVLQGLFFTYN